MLRLDEKLRLYPTEVISSLSAKPALTIPVAIVAAQVAFQPKAEIEIREPMVETREIQKEVRNLEQSCVFRSSTFAEEQPRFIYMKKYRI